MCLKSYHIYLTGFSFPGKTIPVLSTLSCRLYFSYSYLVAVLCGFYSLCAMSKTRQNPLTVASLVPREMQLLHLVSHRGYCCLTFPNGICPYWNNTTLISVQFMTLGPNFFLCVLLPNYLLNIYVLVLHLTVFLNVSI